MKTNEKVEHARDNYAEGEEMAARKPLRVEAENRRRYIRLEIAAPMSLQKIKDLAGNFWPEGDWHVINGTVLNISAGGVLVEVDQAVNEGDVVSMHFTLQDVEGLDHVLGFVKRVDSDQEGFIAGIEFISRARLADCFTNAEVDILSEEHVHFDESVRRLLNKYVYRERVAAEGK